MTAPLAIVGYYEPWWIQILKAIIIFAVGLQLVPVVLLAERKLLGRFQSRYGPNRVGPYGALQPLADILKLLTKEQFRPTTSIGFLFVLAPIISILTAVAAFAIIPFGNVQDIFGTRVGLYGIDVSIGPLYLFAFGGIAFYGIMLGGWSSGSKYSFLGAMRGAAQLISYEVSQGLALVGVIFTAQTLSLTGIVEAQKGMWYIVPQFFGFLIFLTASFAETNRAPFDLTEADAELVGGYNTEYGGGRFASYYFAEYLNVLVVSGIVTTVFLGGWLLAVRHPPARLGRPVRRALQDVAHHLPLHLGPRDAPAPALRPADELRLEGPPAAGNPQRTRHRNPRRGHPLMPESPQPISAQPAASAPTSAPSTGLNVTAWSPGEDVIEVMRTPAPGPARGTWRTFGETAARPDDDLRPLHGNARHGPVPGGEDARLPALPRPAQAPPLRGHPPGEVRRLLALRRRLPGRLHPRGRRREHAREPRLRRRALRGGV